jgi:hypothetical protein
MSLWNDEKYLRLLSSQLARFSQKAPQHYNCRCPFCGDSTQSKIKARGYFFPSTNALIYKCHNCGLALPFAAFLQRTSRALYDEYVMEVFRDQQPRTPETPLTVPAPSRVLVTYEEMQQLSSPYLAVDIQPVRDYVLSRGLPDSACMRLYGTTRAHTFLKPLVGDKAERVVDGLPYLVIPLRFGNGEWYGAQFRLLTRKEYITFRWGHDALRVFGLNTIDVTKTIYVVEGPLDSLCLSNAIAMCGSDLLGGLHAIEQYLCGTPLPHCVLVWDNEPRNAAIVKCITTAVQRGHKVVIWPSNLPKDINDMYANGLPVQSLVETHTYQGLRAELELQTWRK